MKGKHPLFNNKNAIQNSHLKLNLQLFAEMPKNESQIKHIMSDRNGHLPDSEENRKILIDLTNDDSNYIGVDSYGNKRYVKTIDGKQYWASVRNDVIQNGGVNNVPFKKLFDKKGEFKK